MRYAIGLAGRGGVGKTTTARAIELLDPRFQRLPIGEPLKAMLRAFYTFTDLSADEIERKLDGDLKRSSCFWLGGQTPTYAQQSLGTEWGRNLISRSLWLDIWVHRAASRAARGLGSINDSVRFQNEVSQIHALGGIVVKLTGRGDLEGGHASEAGVDADAEIAVDADPIEIARRVLAIAAS